MTNTLENNGRWYSQKADLEMGVMGAQDFMVTQRGLAGGRMDLGAWHGYQEVFVEDFPEAASIAFQYELEKEDGYKL